MIQGLRFFALALALAGSCQACILGQDPDKEYPLETYVKNYETINEYLERKVATSDLSQNLAIAKEKLSKEQSKLSFRRHISLEKALGRFIRLSREVIHGNPFQCARLLKGIETNNQVLGNEPNTKLRRIGEIIENAESNFLEFCRAIPLDSSRIEFSFKTKSFDKINSLLLKKEPKNMDPEVDMAKVDELLAETGEGALREALQMLASLGTVLDGGCLVNENMVVLKNLVAARRSILNRDMEILGAMRRIDRLVLHYAHRYSSKCSEDLFPEQLKTIFKQVDTMYHQRFQASELLVSKDTQVAETRFQTEFTKPEVVEHVMSIPEKASLHYKGIVVPCQNYLGDTEKFFKRFEYLKPDSTERIDELPRDQVGLSLGFASYRLCEALIRPWHEHLSQIQNNQGE